MSEYEDIEESKKDGAAAACAAGSGSTEPRKVNPHTMALRVAQQWRPAGQLPQWALQVPLADLEHARAAIAASDDKCGGELYREVTVACAAGAAAAGGHESHVKALIAAGADVHWANEREHGKTVAWVSAVAGHAALVGALAAAGADLDRPALGGTTPLVAAAAEGRVCTVALLIDAGATIDLADGSGFTPLHRAASYGHRATVKALVKAGAKLDLPTHNIGITPLMTAARAGRRRTVELLLYYGADRTARDTAYNLTAREWAREWSEERGGREWGDAFWGKFEQQQQQQQQQPADEKEQEEEEDLEQMRDRIEAFALVDALEGFYDPRNILSTDELF